VSINIIIKEFCRSFLKNSFTNILLIILFSLSFFVGITMLTYYFDIGGSEMEGLVEDYLGRDWYALRIDSEDGLAAVNQTTKSPRSFERMSEFYRTMTNNEAFSYLSYYTGQCVYAYKKDLDQKIGRGNYDNFLDYVDTPDDAIIKIEEMDDRGSFEIAALKCAHLNYQSAQIFDFKLSHGENFTKENTTMHNEESAVPVILGNSYEKYYEIGDEFEIEPMGIGEFEEQKDDFMKVKVIGILKKDEMMPAYGSVERTQNLNDYMLCASGCNFEYHPESMRKALMFESCMYVENILYSFISPKEGYSYNDIIHEINDNIKKYDMFPLLFTSVSFGSEALQNETRASILSLSILSFIMIAFLIFCLVSSGVSRFMKNAKTYAVYLVNGCHIGNIIIPYILEMIIVVMPAILFNYYLLEYRMTITDNKWPFIAVLGMSLAVILTMGELICRKLSKLEIENYMKTE